MQRLLIIGCGDIARRALPWLVKHYRVYAAVRSDSRNRELRALGVTPLRADLDKPHSLKRLAGIGNMVLHFAPPQETGPNGKTWYARGQNFIIAYAEPEKGAVYAREAQPDEYVVLVPDSKTAIEITTKDGSESGTENGDFH